MGLLINESEKTLTYLESKQYQQMLKRASALQLTKLFKKFWKLELDEKKRLIHGTEQEMHLLAAISNKQAETQEPEDSTEFSVFLDRDSFIKQIPKELASRLEIVPEYAQWMVELIPHKPFQHLLNLRDLRSHLDDTNKLNRLKIEMTPENNKDKTYLLQLLSVTSMPKLGYADYFIRKDGSKIALEDREKSNHVSNSKYFIDSTIGSHIRFSTLTKNTAQKRNQKVEINIPIFIDKKTRIRYPGLYTDTENYQDRTFSIQEKILSNMQEDKFLKQVNFD